MQAPAAASTGASGAKDDGIKTWDEMFKERGRVPFAEFQEFFEIAVLDAEDLRSETKLALLKVVDKNQDGYVTKTEWTKMKMKAKKDFGNDTKIAIKGYLRHIGGGGGGGGGGGNIPAERKPSLVAANANVSAELVAYVKAVFACGKITADAQELAGKLCALGADSPEAVQDYICEEKLKKCGLPEIRAKQFLKAMVQYKEEKEKHSTRAGLNAGYPVPSDKLKVCTATYKYLSDSYCTLVSC